MQLYGDAQYRLEIYDLEQRKVIEEFLYGRNKYFSKSDFSPEEDVNYLVRIEFVEGSGYVPFSIYTDYSLDPVRSPKGTTIKGSLSHEDRSYIRQGYYADRYTFNLAGGVIYKVKVSSETLDPVIVAKWYKDDLRIMEVY